MANDKAILGHLLRELADTCQICGCHGDSCRVGGGELCVWLDARKTLCSNPACALRAMRNKKKYERGVRRGSKSFRGRAA